MLYAVVTLPEGDEGTLALLCFVDDKTGRITKTVPLPTWKPVSWLEAHASSKSIKRIVFVQWQTEMNMHFVFK